MPSLISAQTSLNATDAGHEVSEFGRTPRYRKQVVRWWLVKYQVYLLSTYLHKGLMFLSSHKVDRSLTSTTYQHIICGRKENKEKTFSQKYVC